MAGVFTPTAGPKILHLTRLPTCVIEALMTNQNYGERFSKGMDFSIPTLDELMHRRGHAAALNVSIEDHGENWIELSIPYDSALIGDVESGCMASGPIISLVDMASAQCIWVRLNQFVSHVTLDLHIDYLRPAETGKRVYCRSECIGVTKNVFFARSLTHDGEPGRPIAQASASFIRPKELGT